MTNPILEQLTQHRSIREFEDRPLSPHQVTELVNAAQHASTSTFSQQYSIVSVSTCLVSAESGRIVENRLRSLSCQIIQA
ncbi:nitroreductase family protein, partial [Lacticaseibacillus paracasei]|uniref:nitroreductase family protein n=1 Tax=Lacticaseibacillus paracasei TaxID=1597 RepID=UPI0025A237E1